MADEAAPRVPESEWARRGDHVYEADYNDTRGRGHGRVRAVRKRQRPRDLHPRWSAVVIFDRIPDKPYTMTGARAGRLKAAHDARRCPDGVE